MGTLPIFDSISMFSWVLAYDLSFNTSLLSPDICSYSSVLYLINGFDLDISLSKHFP
jgi:hypothetical protein